VAGQVVVFITEHQPAAATYIHREQWQHINRCLSSWHQPFNLCISATITSRSWYKNWKQINIPY